MEEIILYFSLKHNGDFNRIYKALESKEQVNRELEQQLFGRLDSKYVTILSKEYPEALKLISTPPFVLYYHGNLELLKYNPVAIIGSEKPTIYGIEVTKKYVDALVENRHTLITNDAEGISKTVYDENSSKLENQVLILCDGINTYHKKSMLSDIKESKLVISEFPFSADVEKLELRKKHSARLVSGLSSKIIVPETRKDEQQVMSVVGNALQQGKDVYCVPSAVDSLVNGTNYLIQQGVGCTIVPEDIIGNEKNIDKEMEYEITI